MPPTPVQLLRGELDVLPERVVAALTEAAGVPVSLYVLDLEGRALVRAAGALRLPAAIELPRRIGPVLFHGCAAEVEAAVVAAVDGARVHPLWLRGQTALVAVSEGEPARGLGAALDAAAVALEVGAKHTDVVHVARRVRETTTAAELQQELLPPPIARDGDAELAAVILPAYRVGGDWYDWSNVRGELRFSVGDAVGRGEAAMALGAVALSANRAARRRAESVEAAAAQVHEAVAALGGDLYVTTVLAAWDRATATVRWVRCGHPVPLHVRADGSRVDVPDAGLPPLGAFDDLPEPIVHETRLEPGDRFVLYSDGITEARRRDGSFFGEDGLAAGVARHERAPGTVRGVLCELEEAVPEIEDDATLLVLRRDADG